VVSASSSMISRLYSRRFDAREAVPPRSTAKPAAISGALPPVFREACPLPTVGGTGVAPAGAVCTPPGDVVETGVGVDVDVAVEGVEVSVGVGVPDPVAVALEGVPVDVAGVVEVGVAVAVDVAVPDWAGVLVGVGVFVGVGVLVEVGVSAGPWSVGPACASATELPLGSPRPARLAPPSAKSRPAKTIPTTDVRRISSRSSISNLAGCRSHAWSL
jgi:hypothetical protein